MHALAGSLAALIALACSGEQPADVALVDPRFPKLGIAVGNDGAPDLRNVELHLHRFVCFGDCPSYDVWARGDGLLLWQGQVFVATRGQASARFDPSVLVPILADLERVDFFDLPASRITGTRDSWETELELTVGPRTNRVWLQELHRLVDRRELAGDTAARLSALADHIDEVLNTRRWIGSDEERLEIRGIDVPGYIDDSPR